MKGSRIPGAVVPAMGLVERRSALRELKARRDLARKVEKRPAETVE
jgi:hypothetical protein